MAVSMAAAPDVPDPADARSGPDLISDSALGVKMDSRSRAALMAKLAGQDPAAVTYTLKCDAAGPPPGKPDLKACSADYCLFNVATDPCEYHDVAKAHPDIVASIVARLADYQATAVGAVQPEGCVPVITDGAWRPCDSPDPNSTNPHATRRR